MSAARLWCAPASARGRTQPDGGWRVRGSRHPASQTRCHARQVLGLPAFANEIRPTALPPSRRPRTRCSTEERADPLDAHSRCVLSRRIGGGLPPAGDPGWCVQVVRVLRDGADGSARPAGALGREPRVVCRCQWKQVLAPPWPATVRGVGRWHARCESLPREERTPQRSCRCRLGFRTHRVDWSESRRSRCICGAPRRDKSPGGRVVRMSSRLCPSARRTRCARHSACFIRLPSASSPST